MDQRAKRTIFLIFTGLFCQSHLAIYQESRKLSECSMKCLHVFIHPILLTMYNGIWRVDWCTKKRAHLFKAYFAKKDVPRHSGRTLHMNKSCHMNEWVMSKQSGLQINRLVKITCSYRLFLQKRPINQLILIPNFQILLNRIWAMSHMDEFCHVLISHVTYEWVMSHMNESRRIIMSHVTYEWGVSRMKKSYHTYPCLLDQIYTYW